MVSPLPRIAVIGECMVELRETEAQNFIRGFSGDTFNTAFYMANLVKGEDVFVDYVSAVGDDHLSREMLYFWKNMNIGTGLVQTIQGRQPGLYIISVDENGERSFTYWRGEAAFKDAFETEESQMILDQLQNYDLIYLSGISLAVLKSRSKERLLARLESLAQMGTAIAFDFNYRPVLWKNADEAKIFFKRVLPLSRWVLATKEELSFLDLPADKLLSDFILKYLPTIELVVKDGAHPCRVFNKDGCIEVAGNKVEKVIDTTAAGDSFSAAYLLSRLLNTPIKASAVFAHALATVVISHPGAIVPNEFIKHLSRAVGMGGFL